MFKNGIAKCLWIGLMIILVACCTKQFSDKTGFPNQIVWTLDNLDRIGGHSVEVLGNPQIIPTGIGKIVLFDGDGDRLLVNNNPVYGATEFTIEIIFNPADVYPDNTEPRFFHIEDQDNKDRRITIELRLNNQHQWYLDTFIKSDISKHTLADEKLTHPVGQWTHAAITYKDRVFTSYINGVKELSATVGFLPIAESAKTSIGARMNQVHWFNGAISRVAVTHRALKPEVFAILSKVPKHPSHP